MKNLSDYRVSRALTNYKVVGSCHIYQGNRSIGGYATYSHKRMNYNLHRVVLAKKLGKTYEELSNALHTRECTDRACINENHLYEGSTLDNIRDSIAAGTHNSSYIIQSCINGHEYTKENTYINPRTKVRFCRSCDRAHGKAKYLRKVRKARREDAQG